MAIQSNPPATIANRYRVDGILGRGGMAVVYEVHDSSTGRRLALKQLLARKGGIIGVEITGLFEHEFYTLTQLGHPRVVEVYDYGLADNRPYYTMELLGGGDLRELSPVPWQKACALLRDICSALSLLHSRRLVHRDLTPRNVRCSEDGRAKLIDFGAMVPIGRVKQLVGTPPFIAPEVLDSQPLDPRVDLYALGATAYYTLTGRHAYPARSIQEIRELWRRQPKPPSDFINSIPEELDQLVLALLNFDPLARPTNAAEVMERLTAIADLKIDEQLLVSQAYLSTPALVGRDPYKKRVRDRVIQALGKHGGTILIEGAGGVGRSRFLDACVLEGKLAGAVVLRMDASDAHSGNWGAARSLITQLSDALPESTPEIIKPHLGFLGKLFPELLERSKVTSRYSLTPGFDGTWFDGTWVRFVSSHPPEMPSRPLPEVLTANRSDLPQPDASRDSVSTDQRAEVWGGGISWKPPPPSRISIEPDEIDSPQEHRRRTHAALRDILLKVSEQRCLFVAVDDVHKLDEPSAAFVAFLSSEIYQHPVVVVATHESGAQATSAAALKLIAEAGSILELENLNIAQTEELLGSIFGNAPNLKLLADRIFTLSRGNPRAVMQLAQHLVDRDLVRYQAGSWTLLSEIDVNDLPDSVVDTFKARVSKLRPRARRLAGTFALAPDRSFTFDECIALTEDKSVGELVEEIDALIASEILSTDGHYYAIEQQGWIPVLLEGLSASEKRAGYLGLAEIFESRETEEFRVIQNLYKAGEETRALDRLIDFTRLQNERIEGNAQELSEFITSLPSDWMETYQNLREIAIRSDRTAKEKYILHIGFVSYSEVENATDKALLVDIIAILYHACGLGIFHELADPEEPTARLMRALELAQKRFDATGESDRILAPGEAIRALATALVLAIKLAGTAFDRDLIASVPSIEPLVPLTPALGVVQKNVSSTAYLTAGLYEKALAGYRAILDRIAQPDRAGLEDAPYTYVRLSVIYVIGMVEASLGMASSLEAADAIEHDPAFQVNAFRIRMVYHLFQSEAKKAEAIKKQIELLQIQNSPIQFFEGTHLLSEVIAYGASDDLIKVKQTISGIEKMVESFDTWLPILRYAQGEYHRLRGDYPSALAILEQSLEQTAPGRHVVWRCLVVALIKTLYEMKRYSHAVERGRRLLMQAVDAELGIFCESIRVCLAQAEAAAGAYQQAIENSEAAIHAYRTFGTTGMYLGLAVEARARIAVLMRDQDAFQTNVALCGEHLKVGYNDALTAKYEKLIRQARQAGFRNLSDTVDAIDADSQSESPVSTLLTDLTTLCRTSRERVQNALRLLVEQSNAGGGFLYTVRKEGLVLAANYDDRVPPKGCDEMARQLLDSEINEKMETTTTVHGPRVDLEPSDDNTERSTSQKEQYRPVFLGHYGDDGYVITAVAVLVVNTARLRPFPHELVASISKFLLDSGDTEAVITS